MWKKTYPFLIPLFVIIFLQLVVFWPSFNLALFGDDWLGFWLFERSIGFKSAINLNYLNFFLTPYGPQTINQGIIYSIFGAVASPYYIISFIWRFGVAVSLFVVVYKLTKSRLSAFMAGSLFAVTPIGLDATNWVFNMITYIGMIPILFFLQFYYRSKDSNSLIYTLITGLFLFLAIVIVPTRMHGVLVLLLALELTWIFIERNLKSLKNSLIRISLFILIILLIKNIGTSFANPQETVDRSFIGLSTIEQMIQKDRQYEVFFYPITIFGNMVVPDVFWPAIQKSSNVLLGSSRPIWKLTFLVYGTSLIVGYFLLKNKGKSYLKTYFKIAIFWTVFTLGIYIVRKIDNINFSRSDYLGATLVGGYSMILMLFLAWSRTNKAIYKRLIFTGVVWAMAFIAVPWIFYPYIVYPTAHRYMTISSLGLGIIWGMLNLLKINRRVLIFLFIIQLLIQGVAANGYLSDLVQRRSRFISEKIWDSLEKKLPTFEETEDFKVIYFASDDTNGDIVYNNVFFGFPPRIALEYGISDTNKIPVALTTYPDLVSMAIDGQAFKAQGREVKPVSLDRIYAYAITGDELENIKVVDIRDEVIQDLKERIYQIER
jgi:hypothetical protein